MQGFEHRGLVSLSAPKTSDVQHNLVDSQAMMPRPVQFINLSNPAAGLPSSSQRQSRSHAAREAHAKARRLRTAKYQASRRRQHDQGGTAQIEARYALASPKLAREPSSFVISSPLSLLGSARTDPFSSYSTMLTHVDYFLLDHCMPCLILVANSSY